MFPNVLASLRQARAIARGFTALIITLAGCSPPPRVAGAAHEPDRVIAELTLPDGGPFRSVRIRRVYDSGGTSGGGGGHGMFGGGTRRYPPRYRWVLESTNGAPAWTYTVQAHHPSQASDSIAREAARIRLSAATDARGFAYSLDGGAQWSYVALDLAGGPWVFPARAPRPGADFRNAFPESRTLLIEELRAGVLGSIPTDPSAQFATTQLPSTLLLVCARPDDEQLADVAIQVFLRTENPLHVDMPLHPGRFDCLQRAAEHMPALRLTLRNALSLPASGSIARPPEMAAWVLAKSGGEEDQIAIARVLTEPVAPRIDVPAAGHKRWYLSWSLAALTQRRATAPDEAVRALIAIAANAPPIPYASWDLVRVCAVRGLAALPQNEETRAALRRIAAGQCSGPLPALSIEFVRPSESQLDASGFALACWARAALGMTEGADAGG